VRMHDDSPGFARTKRRFDDDESLYDKRGHRQRLEEVEDTPDEGSRWSTWDRAPFTEGDGYAVSVHELVSNR